MVLFGEDEESLRRRVGVAGFNGNLLRAVHDGKVRLPGRSGAEVATSNALGNAAEQFVCDGVGGLGEGVDRGVVPEDLDTGAPPDIEAGRVDHAAVHAHRTDDGPELSAQMETGGPVASRPRQAVRIADGDGGDGPGLMGCGVSAVSDRFAGWDFVEVADRRTEGPDGQEPVDGA